MPPPSFIPLGIALLTISDSRRPDNDKSGDILEKYILESGHGLIHRAIVTDDRDKICARIRPWLKDENVHAVIATGSTGLTGRDCAPEAFADLYEKEIPGFGEVFRMLSYRTIGTSTIQSRAGAGVANGTYMFTLPGSPGACRDAWEHILCHQLDSRTRPCNLVDIIPRLKEKR